MLGRANQINKCNNYHKMERTHVPTLVKIKWSDWRDTTRVWEMQPSCERLLFEGLKYFSSHLLLTLSCRRLLTWVILLLAASKLWKTTLPMQTSAVIRNAMLQIQVQTLLVIQQEEGRRRGGPWAAARRGTWWGRGCWRWRGGCAGTSVSKEDPAGGNTNQNFQCQAWIHLFHY